MKRLELHFSLRVTEEGEVLREDNFDRDLKLDAFEHYIHALESYWRELGELLAPGMVGEFGRLRSIAAKKTDPIVMEIMMGSMAPGQKRAIEEFFKIRGFESFQIVEIQPGRGPVKWSVIEEK